MVEHILKTDPDTFDAVFTGKKKHEIRRNDRNFQVGDMLVLKKTVFSGLEMKFDAHPLVYTGDVIRAVVTHIQRGYGVLPDWAILSIDVVGRLSTGSATRSIVPE